MDVKKKEIIRFECKECKLNYCINHRLSFDHFCKIKIDVNNNKLNIDNKDVNKNQLLYYFIKNIK